MLHLQGQSQGLTAANMAGSGSNLGHKKAGWASREEQISKQYLSLWPLH